MRTPDVLVVGGGIVGAAIAERLSRAGRSVSLLERGEVGAEASWAAAGLLVPVHPWRHPEPLLALEAKSLPLWEPLASRLLEETGIDLEPRRTGLLSLIETDADERAADDRVAWFAAHGEECRRVHRDESVALEPLLAGDAESAHGAGSDLRGALWLPAVVQIRNHRAARACAVAAARRGAEIETGVEVRELLRDGDRVVGVRTSAGDRRSGTVVLAAGAWTGAILDDQCPAALRTVPCRGQIVLLRAAPGAVRQMILSSGEYVVPRKDGAILVGSTVEYAGFDRSTTHEATARLRAFVARVLPGLRGATFECAWAGLRPDTPDHLPSIGHAAPGLLAATGHFRSGIMLAPATAEAVLDLLDARPRTDLAPFDPLR